MNINIRGDRESRAILVSALLLLFIVIPVSAMWSTRLGINVSVNTGSFDPGIHSYKGYLIETHCVCHSCCVSNITRLSPDELYLSPDSSSLILDVSLCDDNHHHNRTTCHHCHSSKSYYVLIGILVKNYGTIPVTLQGVNIYDQNPSGGVWSVYKKIYYGPITHLPTTLWNAIRGLILPPGSTSPPITLDPGDYAIIVLTLKLEPGEYDLVITPAFSQFNHG